MRTRILCVGVWAVMMSISVQPVLSATGEDMMSLPLIKKNIETGLWMLDSVFPTGCRGTILGKMGHLGDFALDIMSGRVVNKLG